MPRHVDRFLRHAELHREGPTLGRVFAVTRETWALSDDPRQVPPKSELLITWRTAADAADLARAAAEEFPEHGFHKPSASWWGSDGTHFHRFVVHPGLKRAQAVLVGAGVLGLAGVALLALLRPGRRRETRA
jgi:hypothetical protein